MYIFQTGWVGKSIYNILHLYTHAMNTMPRSSLCQRKEKETLAKRPVSRNPEIHPTEDLMGDQSPLLANPHRKRQRMP